MVHRLNNFIHVGCAFLFVNVSKVKYLLGVIILMTILGSCSHNPKAIENDNLFSSSIPDLHFFNINGKVKNSSVYLTQNSDTVFIYRYDTLGRLKQYNYTKAFSRKENLCYFDKTSFPIYKSIRVDYSLWYNGSLVKINNDTIKTFWYAEFGEIEDTATYIFKDNKIQEIFLPPLNDHDRERVKKTFFYNGNELKKIITTTLWGEANNSIGRSDSVVTSFSYTNNVITHIVESVYYKHKADNYNNHFYFNNSGAPVKFTLRDTIPFTITTSEVSK